ncbi:MULTISPECIES: alpha/beta fold hydrolase [Brevibacillus]|jgi:pimeloyl-[acyl-carrier protein] methyl ester esterase|uniref:alpha/beta fold hydrolase n=1 Tax=Brevibacillus TaxID=55080 RepID=UPI0004F39CBD|nr:alpha/beta hydrolase [Brevibacillus borstelensis]KKX54773.1 hypothetical protein X546_13230 [Brevibacillus borstelensis cifa_chp40]MCM3468966.1 alpha/beta hydrolase [Brevibacillus borstelensis]MCM3558549.1 alpha/beta hydrolase [Brevibacillus borstelensis]MCM3591460.1 alpha/beta hydrolase [Brevibacillus borstelensis]MCM3624894.1 alpha/beta hydrolase [Brevibacillus borstelensis]
MKAVMLWINGWAMPDEVWEPIVDALDDCEHRRPDYSRIVHPEQFYTAVREQLSPLRSMPLIVIGWSMGGMLGLRLAQESAVDGLIAIGTAARFVGSRGDGSSGWQDTHLRLMSRKLTRNREQVIGDFHYSMFTQAERERIADVGVRLADKWPQPTLLAGLSYLQKEDCSPLLPEIACPVTVIHGTEDGICPYRAGVELASGLSASALSASALSSARLVSVPGGGHAIPLLYPEIIIEEAKRMVGRYGK